ncbi:DUF1700 domain-containing protein [Amycolatopsis suaedae]|uniref:Proline-rich protein n=1 Tax=Amycolatopsis suaedae TaxID=2510978 RepID=A0A4Q7JAE0_9PSEU|nr:hypothetical protein [Amycolatopsis suaedae]RZQ64751.1 hypothetical protein EWH70_07640 [Amycolatopsis suaedae]
MTTQTPAAVRVYLARVRTALADLPDAEVDEILEDVRPQLNEIGAELGDAARVETLTERLGSPESYAAELRAAGGYPPLEPPEMPAGQAKPSPVAARFAVWSMIAALVVLVLLGFGVALEPAFAVLAVLLLVVPVLVAGGLYAAKHDERIRDLPEVRWLHGKLTGASAGTRRVLDYLLSLRPAWWLLCAAVLLVVGLMLFVRRSEGLAALVLLALAGAAVVWLGPKSAGERKWLWLSLPVSAFVFGSTFGLVAHAIDAVKDRMGYSGGYSSYPGQAYNNGQQDLLYNGNYLDNVYAFDAQGKPITDFYLYTEDGKPILMPRYGCEPGTESRRKLGEDNRFPRPRIETGAYDDNGNYNGYNAYRPDCREITGVPFTAAIPAPPVVSVPAPPPPPPPPSAPSAPSSPPPPPTPTK